MAEPALHSPFVGVIQSSVEVGGSRCSRHRVRGLSADGEAEVAMNGIHGLVLQQATVAVSIAKAPEQCQ